MPNAGSFPSSANEKLAEVSSISALEVLSPTSYELGVIAFLYDFDEESKNCPS